MPNNNPTGRNQYSAKPAGGGSRQAGGEHPAPSRATSGTRTEGRGEDRDRSGGQRGTDPGSRGKHH